MVTWQVAGEDSLANGFILSLLDTEDTEAQEFLQKWVIMFEFPCHTVHAFVTSHEMVELVSIAVIERTALCYYWYWLKGGGMAFIGSMPSVLWCCWLSGRKGIWPVKNWVVAGVVICLEQGADLHMAQLMPLPLTVSCFSKIQIGFSFLVPAHPGSPGKRAVKRACVCVCLLSGVRNPMVDGV